MMGADDLYLWIGIIGGMAGLVGMIFGIYKSYHKPQEEMEIRQAVTDKEIGNKASLLAAKEMENKAEILRREVEREKNANEKKFCEMSKKIEDAFLLATNHTHTVDTKVDKLIEAVNTTNLLVMKLDTKIDERMPKK